MTRKILLADDSATIRRVAELTFSDEDFTVIAVADGEQALQRARASRPDIIVADVAMPGLDGFELCRRVKADPALRAIPFLFLKSAFNPFDEAQAAACGADGSIVKPFEAQEMINRVKELLARAPLPRPAEPPRPAVEADLLPPAQPEPAPASRPGDEFTFDFGDVLEDRFAAPSPPAYPAPPPPPVTAAMPAVPVQPEAAAPPVWAVPPPAPVAATPIEPPAELEEDLWSEVILRDHGSDLLAPGEASGSSLPGFADETVFDEVPASPAAPVQEAEPEAVRAVFPSLASPPPAPAPVPAPAITSAPAAPAIDPAEIERIVVRRMEAVVRQVLEPVVKDLARRTIEQVSWEVIPDLAEAMIREEIDRVSRSADTG